MMFLLFSVALAIEPEIVIKPENAAEANITKGRHIEITCDGVGQHSGVVTWQFLNSSSDRELW